MRYLPIAPSGEAVSVDTEPATASDATRSKGCERKLLAHRYVPVPAGLARLPGRAADLLPLDPSLGQIRRPDPIRWARASGIRTSSLRVRTCADPGAAACGCSASGACAARLPAGPPRRACA